MTKIDMYKGYEVSSVCREDLKGRYTMKQIKSLSDDDMQWIARKMGDGISEDYWIALEYAMDRIIDERKI